LSSASHRLCSRARYPGMLCPPRARRNAPPKRGWRLGGNARKAAVRAHAPRPSWL